MRCEILLTADRTLMSNYHGNEFLGFGPCAPTDIFSNWLFQAIFFPPIRTVGCEPVQAPYSLRKIEAKLMDEGFNVLTVDPDHLQPYISDAKALGIHVMDPLGFGPASTTFARLLRTGEPYLSKHFRRLLEKKEVRDAKRRGLRIIVGGPGAWQFKLKPEFMDKHGIDCVVDGESEKVIGDIFRKAINNDDLPKFYDVNIKDTPSLEDIPNIRKPSINGLVEIGRGCCRGCSFCSVTLRPLRWYPYEKVWKELKVNADSNLNYSILHAEDVLLYGSRDIFPVREKVLKLHKLCKGVMKKMSWSHTSMATVATDPKLLREVAEIIEDENQDWWGAEVGIETGSPELIRKTMPAKVRPFKVEDWPDVVKTAAASMMDNNLVPACTLIVGLPQETDDDIARTIELVDDLRGFKSLIVPLFFVPLGRLKDKDWFTVEDMNDLHKELFVTCLNHDVYWAKRILKSYSRGRLREATLTLLYRLFLMMVERKAREIRFKPTHPTAKTRVSLP
ncbi:MAG: radical SAM protein, partial [Candidatus Bathyarchaeia archaeon]